ncbi:unnamed protein product, partial [Iphiclides podalirius]
MLSGDPDRSPATRTNTPRDGDAGTKMAVANKCSVDRLTVGLMLRAERPRLPLSSRPPSRFGMSSNFEAS